MDKTNEAIGTGIITAISALLGVWITQRYETKKRVSEEKRWYVDYFLNKKIDSITNLHNSLMSWYFSITLYGNYRPSTLKEFNDQVQPKTDTYLRSLAAASIYLNPNEYSTMTKTLGVFRQATTAIWLSLPDDQCPVQKKSYGSDITELKWGEFEQAYVNAEALIKEQVNPEILKHVPFDQKMF